MIAFGYPFEIERKILVFYGSFMEQKLLERLKHTKIQDIKYSL